MRASVEACARGPRGPAGDETKSAIVSFWHAAAVAPEQPPDPQSSALAVAADPRCFRRLLDSFVSLRPNERHLRFNRELLPPFYGLLRAALTLETGDHEQRCAVQRKANLHTLYNGARVLGAASGAGQSPVG